VCQRFDLLPDEDTHDYDLPKTEAFLKYRSEPNTTDRELAEFYWESIWLEGAKSPVLSAMREKAETAGPKGERSIVVLAGEADAKADVSSKRFLPISILPGLLDDSVPISAQYGTLRRRVRERLAWDLASRVKLYSGRLLVVIGAANPSDLDFLYEIIEGNVITDLQLLIIWPENVQIPHIPENSFVQVHVRPGSIDKLLTAIKDSGAHKGWDVPRLSIRINNKSMQLTASKMDRISSSFVLLTEEYILPPAQFTLEDLLSFLNGDLLNWRAYGAGLPIERNFKSDLGLSFQAEVMKGIDCIMGDKQLSYRVQLPCEPGAGGTTLIRATSYHTASEGLPTLIMKPTAIDVDVEALASFATDLSETALLNDIVDFPPIVLVFDVEHSSINRLYQIPEILASQGRKCLVIQAITCEQGNEPRRSRSSVRLRYLSSGLQEGEVDRVAAGFHQLFHKWPIPLDAPSIEQWKGYERSMRWIAPSSAERMGSTFWIALRFFLTEGLDFTAAEEVSDALGIWISKRVGKVSDERIKRVLIYLASLSSFRIVCPLMTWLRPLTGGTFNSEILEILRSLDDLIEWGSFDPEIQDQVIMFKHPEFAKEYLRREGIITEEERITALLPLLTELSAGHLGDAWVAEALSQNVLAPPDYRVTNIDWDWRLKAFDSIPPLIRDQSKGILHHWARCLYKSAEASNGGGQNHLDRRNRFELSINKLTIATGLPRRPGKDEHPSHLYNTLGTACWRYGSFLQEASEPLSYISQIYSQAYKAFAEAISLSGGQNVEALLAFSHRLIERVDKNDRASASFMNESTRDIAYALSLLDEAEDVVDASSSPDPSWSYDIPNYRARALSFFNNEEATKYIWALKEYDESDIGYYCAARIEAKDPNEQNSIEKAIQIFLEATNKGIKLSWRSILFLLFLMRKHPSKKFNFTLAYHLYRELESDPEYKFKVIDSFRYAVLCYHTNNYNEGRERFRQIRNSARRSDSSPVLVRDWWRDPQNPSKPRVTTIRIGSITTMWRAKGYVNDIKQDIPLRPRHFDPMPREGEFVPCLIRFEFNGPLAVPERFFHRSNTHSQLYC